MNDENNKPTKPSTDPDVLPSGGSSVGQAAKNTAKKGINSVKNGIKRAVKALWAVLPTQVKIVAIIIGFILIIIAALCLMGMATRSTSVATQNVDDFVSKNSNLDKDAKELYNDKSSLIKMKLKDINSIYNKFVSDNNGGAETQNLMRYKMGTNEVKKANEESRIVDIDDKLPLYKHILLTEKYNFNKVKWTKFSHSDTAGNEVKNFKEDKELGLKYPDDSKYESGAKNENPIKLDKFIDLTLPYLQTWYIPLSMSNASFVSGTEKDNSRAPAFSYNIIKEAYSNIVVNWYELKEYEEKTQYETYTESTRNDTLTNVVVEVNTKNNDPLTNSTNSPTYTIKTDNTSVNTEEKNNVDKDTSTTNGLAGGKKDPMKEKHLSSSTSYSSSMYIAKAETFDLKIVNKFNYEIYSESDAQKRINADSSNESSSSYSIDPKNEWNKAANAKANLKCDVLGNIVSTGNTQIKSVTLTGSVTGSFGSGKDAYSITTNVYTVTLGDYVEYTNAQKWTVTRKWKDKLSQEDSKTSKYTVDDLLAYNQSDDRKEKVSQESLCGKSYTSSSDTSNQGTSVAASQIKIGNYTYPVYTQGNMQNTTKHGGDLISNAGCGLCSLTVVINGIKGTSYSPTEVGNNIGWSCPISLADTAQVLKKYYNIDASAVRWDDKNSGNISLSEKKSKTKNDIIKNMQNNNPMIVLINVGDGQPAFGTTLSHYITLVGIDGDNIVISNSAGGVKETVNYKTNGSGPGTINYLIEKMYEGANDKECGYVIAKRNQNSGSNNNSSSNNSSSNNNNKSNNSSGGAGKVITKTDLNSTGYTGIYESSITGRKFKEYKQNPSGNKFLAKYPGPDWGTECGSISTIIVGSGYSDKATIADVAEKLKHSPTMIESWLKGYAKKAEVKSTNLSNNQIIKQLKSGSVLVIHVPGYRGAGHYMALLDVNEKNQVYLSNPDYYADSNYSSTKIRRLDIFRSTWGNYR